MYVCLPRTWNTMALEIVTKSSGYSDPHIYVWFPMVYPHFCLDIPRLAVDHPSKRSTSKLFG